jgi:hypothetical protein
VGNARNPTTDERRWTQIRKTFLLEAKIKMPSFWR